MLREIEYKNYPILYVDGNEEAVQTFAKHFDGDFTVCTAREEKQALQALEGGEIAVVIVALDMADQGTPQTGGLEFLERVKAEHPDAVRVLLADGRSADLAIQAVIAGSVYRYILKPYDGEETRSLLLEAIDRYFLMKERERLYFEKVETMRKIARANRLSAMGVLASGMAHEINNPLVSISTFLQMLPQKYSESSKDEEYWGELYRVALHEVERIRQLVQQLLNYSGPAQPSRFEPIRINEVLQEMVLFVENEAAKKEVQIRRDFAHDLPIGRMDRNRIKQVFLNILLNAVQAMGRGGVITVSSRSVQDGAEPLLQVEVSDTGSGISEENLEKLFTPFFTTKNREGSGLGLMTCHHIIDEHRGTIDVRSALGKGSTFTVRFPVNPEAYERRKSHRRTILLSDL